MFRIGERVEHQSMGTGLVIDVDPVCVQYDQWKSVGKYDDNWFRIYPRALKHAADVSAEPK